MTPALRLVPMPATPDSYGPEPTDEELWLVDIARRVETDARPLFAAVWIWLLERALEADEIDGEDEPA